MWYAFLRLWNLWCRIIWIYHQSVGRVCFHPNRKCCSHVGAKVSIASNFNHQFSHIQAKYKAVFPSVRFVFASFSPFYFWSRFVQTHISWQTYTAPHSLLVAQLWKVSDINYCSSARQHSVQTWTDALTRSLSSMAATLMWHERRTQSPQISFLPNGLQTLSDTTGLITPRCLHVTHPKKEFPVERNLLHKQRRAGNTEGRTQIKVLCPGRTGTRSNHIWLHIFIVTKT